MVPSRLELLSFEIDIWGKLRHATEAARANLLSAEENRKAVVTILVSDMTTSYFTLRVIDWTPWVTGCDSPTGATATPV